MRAGLRPDPARVVAQLFLPGEELQSAHSRASQVVGRLRSLAVAYAPLGEVLAGLSSAS
jgi:hypothetical protein